MHRQTADITIDKWVLCNERLHGAQHIALSKDTDRQARIEFEKLFFQPADIQPADTPEKDYDCSILMWESPDYPRLSRGRIKAYNNPLAEEC